MKSISNINLGSGGGLGSDQAIFRITNQTLVFNNLVATVSDERILATDAVLVYYADDSIVLNAGITTSWSTGVITFTADSAPTGSVVVNIYVIKPALANVWDSISASEVAYGSSSVKNYLDNLAANQVSYGSSTVKDALDSNASEIQNLQARTNVKFGSMNVNVSTSVSGANPFTHRGSNGTTGKNIIAVTPFAPSADWIITASCRISGDVDMIDVWANGSGTITVRYAYVDK